MAQSDDEDKNAFKYNRYSSDACLTTTAAFVNSLTVDMRAVTQGNLVVHNKGAITLEYELLGTMVTNIGIVAPDGCDDAAKGWVVISSCCVAACAVANEENIVLPYTQVVARIKHTGCCATTGSMWFKGCIAT